LYRTYWKGKKIGEATMQKVSIVLPTYNGEKYIRQSIDSIIGQTFTDWELIIVNDCSTDATPQIAKEYADKDNRIKVIHNEVNKKLPNSLNIGFAASSGEYLTWTSDDNMYEPTAIEEMCDYLDNHAEYMVCAEMECIDENGNLLSDKKAAYSNKMMYLYNCVGACFMYKREVLDTIGDYDNDFFCVEDYDYWIRILNKYGSIGYIEKNLYKYRIHSESLTATKYKKVCIQLSKMRNKYASYIVKTFSDEPEYIWDIYLMSLEAGLCAEDISPVILNLIPQALYDRIPDENKKIIIFGCGFYGAKIYELLKEDVAYFVDNNPSKVGQMYNGIEIISFEQLKKIYSCDKYHIVAAVNNKNDKSYSIIHQLYCAGIRNYSSLTIIKKKYVKHTLILRKK